MTIEQNAINRRKKELQAEWKSVTKYVDLHVTITHIYNTHGKDTKKGGITPVKITNNQAYPGLAEGLTRLLNWLKNNPTLILSTFPESDSD